MDAFSKNGSVVFQIENTGVHIPEAEIPKLFDAFYRMEQSRNRKTGGSGLGLYIVKTILEQHNIFATMVSQIVLLLYIQKQKGVFQNMKKQKITTLLLTMVLCASAVLSGCAASQTEPNQSTTSSTPFEEAKDSGTPISSDEASSVQAYENDEVLSSEEQAKAEQERRAEIAEKYSIYEPYGMTYDTEKDRFFYNGQVVRYFKDQINSNETNGFSYDDGVIDVEPIRDEDGTLTGLSRIGKGGNYGRKW